MQGTSTKYDYPSIARQRAGGSSWAEIVEAHGLDISPESLRGMFSRWLRRQGAREFEETRETHQKLLEQDIEAAQQQAGQDTTRILTVDDLARITSLDQLVEFFRVDLTKWKVTGFKVNKWEVGAKHPKTGEIVVSPLYQVKANLSPRTEENAAEIAIRQLIEDARAHAPAYEPIARPAPISGGDPVLYELAIFDAHLGMLAWDKEVGHDYDSAIAASDYLAAAQHLLSLAHIYPVEKILFVVGNDFLHVDGAAPTVKGSNRGGATTGGTAQDVDSRLAKMFTVARRAAVAAIDQARLIAPVDVLVVQGNHDAQQMYRLGEVLSAWYRLDSEVNVIYSPNKRKFYGYGRNAWMFTHGEEYKRQRDSLPLIFATECPADIWLASEGGSREIHTGHNHIAMSGRYVPTGDLTESRQIRTRSLPGLTPEDAWHHEEGYRHRRTATALAFRKSGGIVGLHEYNP